MALAPCRECGRKISTEASVCPHCGVPEPTEAAHVAAFKKAEKRIAYVAILRVLAVPVGLFLLAGLFGLVKYGSLRPCTMLKKEVLAAARDSAIGVMQSGSDWETAGAVLGVAVAEGVAENFGATLSPFQCVLGVVASTFGSEPELPVVATPASGSLSAIQLPPEVRIPPPPTGDYRSPTVEADPSLGPQYIPRDVEPRLRNGAEIRTMLDRQYPAMLKEAGIGGRVLLWVFVDQSGRVTETKLNTSSGYPALDRFAEQVSARMRFIPAQSDGQPVSVWIAQPIDFSVTN